MGGPPVHPRLYSFGGMRVHRELRIRDGSAAARQTLGPVRTRRVRFSRSPSFGYSRIDFGNGPPIEHYERTRLVPRRLSIALFGNR